MPRPGTVWILLFAALHVAGAQKAPAAAARFPYEAVVEADEAYARCGPGNKTYYPTLRLKRGDRVTVRRQDPGGWFMIEPPPGSFSLVRADDVEPAGNLGTVRRLEQGQTTVRVGSALDPTLDAIFQRKLSSGERVEILGEVTVPHNGRPIRMYQIRPPKGEFRWIEGQNLAAVESQSPRDRQLKTSPVRQEAELDPFAVHRAAHNDSAAARTPRSTRTSIAQIAPQPATSAAPANSNGPGSAADAHTVPTPQLDPRSQLEQIDTEFAAMVRRQPITWNLAEVERAYRDVDQQTNSTELHTQLARRLSAVDHYKAMKSEYDDYYRLVSNTSQRDAQLAAVEGTYAPRNTRPAILYPALAASTNLASLQIATGGSPSGPPNYGPALNVPDPQRQINVAPPQGAVPQQPMNAPQNNPRDFTGPVLQRPVFDTSTPPYQARETNGVPQPGASPAYSANPNVPSNSSQSPMSMFPPVPTGPQNSTGVPIPDGGRLSGETPSPTSLPNLGGERSSPGQTNSTGILNPPPSSSLMQAPISTEPPSSNTPNRHSNAQNGAQPTPKAPFNPVSTEPSPETALERSPSARTAEPAAPPANAPQANPVTVKTSVGPNYPATSVPAWEQNVGTLREMPLAPGGPAAASGPIDPRRMATGTVAPFNGAPQSPAPAPSPQPRPEKNAGLDGAGIIQRAATPVPGGPMHVLLAPNGRILAYLWPERGVNLDGYIGRQMGIRGPRQFHPELQADLIVVRGMIPVRLLP